MISGLPKYIVIQNSRYTVLRKEKGEPFLLVKRSMMCMANNLPASELINSPIVRLLYPVEPNLFIEMGAIINGQFIKCKL